MVEDEEQWINAFVLPENATDRSLAFSSSDNSVVSVSSEGEVYANGIGTASVTVTSVDNPQVWDVLAFEVVEPEYDEAEERDPDRIDPVEIDPDHENVIDYAGDVHVVSDAVFTANGDGTVDVEESELPSGLVAGDVVVFEPTPDNPFGAAVMVDSDGAYDGKLSGGLPDLDDVYDEVDIETYAGVSADGFFPENDIELVSVEEDDIEGEGPDETTIIYPESNSAAMAAQGVHESGLPLQAASVSDLSKQNRLKTQVVSDEGKSTSKFGFKYKGVKFSVSLTGKVKYNFDLWGINELYVGLEAKNEVELKGKLSDMFGTEAIDKKLGRVVFGTPVPGLFLEASVWFHLDADGELNLTVESTSETGVRYTKSDGVRVVTEQKTSPSLKASAELNTGFDFVGTLKICAIDVADPSFDVRFKLGIDSEHAKTRSNGMVCNDLELKFAPSISIGEHQGLCKTLGISYSKKVAEITLKKWHFENGNLVNACTWKGNKKSYDNAGSLLPIDGGMGAWSGKDALRITLTWGASPEDLDSHLLGPTGGGEFHVYYADPSSYENGSIKAFLDRDDTEGFGYETTTVYGAGSGLYHYFVYQFSSDGSIATSGAQVKVYKGNRLLATYDAPANIEDEYWRVFAYDAGNERLYPFEYGATEFDYEYSN